MSFETLARVAVLAGAPVLAVSAPAAQHPVSQHSVTQSAHASGSCYRQLIGTVSSPEYLEASVPVAGKYTVEYDITGTAFFDTYINGAELGYVGGSSGVHHTRAVRLSAGGTLVQVVGPEGSGQAKVYLDQVC